MTDKFMDKYVNGKTADSQRRADRELIKREKGTDLQTNRLNVLKVLNPIGGGRGSAEKKREMVRIKTRMQTHYRQ